MAVLEWDKAGERVFQAGVDRGVLYLQDGTAVPWNGLTSVDDSSDAELKSFYLDGVKFLETVIPGDYVGKLNAFTYPTEFEEVIGVKRAAPGLFFHEQVSKLFNLSYRTKLGNDTQGMDYGYKIHLLYNLTAISDSNTSQTQSGDSIDPTEFSWSLTGTPVSMNHDRSLTHISIDSTDAFPAAIEELESILYGTEDTDPRFPTVIEVQTIFGTFGTLLIEDHGDGTWSAEDAGDDYITMISDTEFQIDDAIVTYLDPDTYEISDTNV